MSLCSQVISPAHCLTERNIWVRLSENRSKGSEDMEWTRNSRVNHMTLTCDLDIESSQLGYVLCTPSQWEENLSVFKWKSLKGFRRYGVDTKFKGKSHDCDIDLESRQSLTKNGHICNQTVCKGYRQKTLASRQRVNIQRVFCHCWLVLCVQEKSWECYNSHVISSWSMAEHNNKYFSNVLEGNQTTISVMLQKIKRDHFTVVFRQEIAWPFHSFQQENTWSFQPYFSR